MHELILGGARSGKSRYAEQQAIESGLEVVYIATAQRGDAEMAARVAEHQARRPSHWSTVESPLQLAKTLQREASDKRCCLVDCLTLWLSNCLHDADPQQWSEQRQQLLQTLPDLPGRILMVTNEVGSGIVPIGELSRRFVDEAGHLHQALAQICEQVTLVTAGLAQKLK